ncbi:hypothetical protein AB1Y20_005500 [Prymnesium parvum]|uniref:Uncharacterized protein n=1 Tax=Prymnesium parvum TaxID=97485 RepID=A0AB34J4C6_PRYPA
MARRRGGMSPSLLLLAASSAIALTHQRALADAPPSVPSSGSLPPSLVAPPPLHAAPAASPAAKHHNVSKAGKPPGLPKSPPPPKPTRSPRNASATPPAAKGGHVPPASHSPPASKGGKADAGKAAASKAANKAELLSFVSNLTSHHHDANKSRADHEEGERASHQSRGVGKLIAWCAAALLTPILIASALVVRARRKQAKGELVPQDDMPPGAFAVVPPGEIDDD